MQFVQIFPMLVLWGKANQLISPYKKKYAHSAKIYTRRFIKLTWANSRRSGLTQIIAVISKYSVGVVASQLFEAKISASFIFTFKLFETLEMFIAAIMSAKNPDLIRLRGIGDIKKYSTQVLYIERGIFVFFIIGYLGILHVVPYILNLFNSNLELLPSYVIGLLSVGFFINRLFWNATKTVLIMRIM